LRRFGVLTALTLTLLAAPPAAEAQSAVRASRMGILQAVAETAPSDRGNMSFLLPPEHSRSWDTPRAGTCSWIGGSPVASPSVWPASREIWRGREST
jgi:hypothetical protein